ncbi:MAG: 3-isopropylmalate dehydrogenase, partial [Chloroflexi bacterium]|nr:3-isopropylmalate dehydrogenase [Chloroflexota bacterium]
IPGDGIGQEVIPAAAQALRALKLDLAFVEAEAGFDCFQRCGEALPTATLEKVRKSDAALFGATSSPSGGMKGYRSPILALRRELNLYANLRPVLSLPGNFSQPGIDLLIVRENSEGLYSGRERREGDTAIAERVVTRAASERIVRVACEQAMQRASQRGKPPVLTVVHKANVLKVSDGLFRECALRVAQEYPQIAVREMLVDAAAMKLVKSPQSFDVLVTTNLFGDILSDEASALVGGLGVAPSANVGEGTPVFEPVHGSAPDIAGQGIANPVGAMLSAAMMLETLGEVQAARALSEAVYNTLANGICTPDLGGSGTTDEFTHAVCGLVESQRNLGEHNARL